MESRSRLSIICSHLLPQSPSPTSRLSSSLTSSASINDAAGDTRNHQLDCVFCRILYEDETCLCILDTSPVSPGCYFLFQALSHYPKSHFSCLEATPPSVVAAMCSKVPSIGIFFQFVGKHGAAAGQVIFHTHIHIIPRKARDCLWTLRYASISLRKRPLNFDQEASQIVSRVREQLSSISPDDEKGSGI
ncbi:adenylylsulfatase HINT [Salix suchowensis]|nr:adenylylsulfatase HINT [Salix suchowensis]